MLINGLSDAFRKISQDPSVTPLEKQTRLQRLPCSVKFLLFTHRTKALNDSEQVFRLEVQLMHTLKSNSDELLCFSTCRRALRPSQGSTQVKYSKQMTKNFLNTSDTASGPSALGAKHICAHVEHKQLQLCKCKIKLKKQIEIILQYVWSISINAYIYVCVCVCKNIKIIYYKIIYL